jgi:3-hydroxyacyl-[acyl-carrier-protein] dehydratase
METATTTLDRTAIEYTGLVEYLPHGFPFLLVDRVIEYEPLKRIRGVKNVPTRDPLMAGDAGSPYPWGLIIESIGQLGILLYNIGRGHRGPNTPEFLLGSLRDVAFLSPVARGCQLTLETRVVRELNQGLVYEGWAAVGSRRVMEIGEMLAVVRARPGRGGEEGGAK